MEKFFGAALADDEAAARAVDADPEDFCEADAVWVPFKLPSPDDPEPLLFLLARSGGNDVNCWRPSRIVTDGALVVVKVTSESSNKDI